MIWNRHAIMVVIDLVFAGLLFYLAWDVLAGDGTIFGFEGTVSTLLAGLGLVLGLQSLLRAFRNTLVLTGQQTSQDDEEIPEYGYQDEWEQENL